MRPMIVPDFPGQTGAFGRKGHTVTIGGSQPPAQPMQPVQVAHPQQQAASPVADASQVLGPIIEQVMQGPQPKGPGMRSIVDISKFVAGKNPIRWDQLVPSSSKRRTQIRKPVPCRGGT